MANHRVQWCEGEMVRWSDDPDVLFCPTKPFFGRSIFSNFFFLLKNNLGVVEERESRASALSLSLLHDDTAIRCEEQLIKH